MAMPDDLMRRMVAELIGTFLLVFAGTGAFLATGDPAFGFAFGFGFGLIAIVYAIGNISGAHVNPAVSLGLAVVGRFPMGLVPYYWISQLIGAVLASLLLRVIHGNVLNLGATQIAEGYSLFDGFLMELVATAVLLFVITAVATDKRVPPAVPGLAIGGTLLVIQLIAVSVTGASVNPARTLGPAIASGTWDDFWVYLLAPLIGAVLGVVGFEFIRGTEEGSPTRMGVNLQRILGGATSRTRAPQRRPAARPEAYERDDYDLDAPPPRRPAQGQRPPQGQRPVRQRPPADAFDPDLPPPQAPRQRPPAPEYDVDLPPQRPTAQPYDPELPPQRPPQRRRPPQQ